MHIPDGYLGPVTSGAAYAAMVPVWAAAGKVTQRTLKAQQVPLLAMSAAFSFVIMMFNVPVPGGSTGHAVGAVLPAILLGPWAACIAVTVALVIQALLFGDGGITAIGANCLTMAFVMVFTGSFVYQALAGRSPLGSARRVFAAGAAGYLGLAAAAFATAVLFGIQPALHHTADGQALYCPYGLGAAIPAMMGSHLLLFCWVEALVTALVIRFLQRREPSLFAAGTGAQP